MDGAATRVSFRFATQDDVPAIVALVESAYRGDGSRIGWTTEADLLHGQRTDAAMVAESMSRPGLYVLLAFDGGEMVGSCELSDPSVAPQSPRGSGRAAYLGMFAVQPSLQGAGVGRAILEEAVRIARDEWGADALELTTIRQREDLIAWYERRGFTRTGEYRAFPYGDERYGKPQRDDLEQAVLSRPLR
ncbi:MAG: GNAT family N-acetyltransferase [Solirubrobacteraceae bacterium]|nr:GNAT family N-acetyltransferase [Solirubrobacteraceae bacterium]